MTAHPSRRGGDYARPSAGGVGAVLFLAAFALSLGQAQAAEFRRGNPGDPNAVIDTPRSAQPRPPVPPHVFDTADKFVPLDRLRVKRSGPGARAASVEDLETVSVTPDGKVERRKLSPELRARLQRKLDREKTRGTPERMTARPKEGEGTRGDVEPVPGAAPRAIIGRDERERVRDTTSFPFRAIGYIGTACSGALIGPRHVLTAGHCVYNINTDKWYKDLSFWPGQNGDRSPYGEIGWSRALSLRGWLEDHEAEYDFALIVLNRDVGNRVGWLGFGYSDELDSMLLNIVGYPGEKANFTMWRESCFALEAVELQVFYDCDTSGGMSGGPVYHYEKARGERTIYVVHAYGYEGWGRNGGTRITETRYDVLLDWLDEY